MDYKGLKAIPNMPKQEVLIMIVVLVLASVWNLVAAVGIGLGIASLMFMKQIGDLTADRSNVNKLGDELGWSDEKGFPKHLREEVYIKRISGPLFFGSTSDFQQLSQQIPYTASAVIIRLDKMRYMDQSGLFAMEDVLTEMTKNDIKIVFVSLMKQPEYILDKIGVIPNLVPTDQIFEHFEDAVEWVKENVEDVY